MEQSIFHEYIRKYFNGVVVSVVETINGNQNPENIRYRHREMLRPEYSPSGLWEAVNIHNTRVAADYVALDASLPVKKRDKIDKKIGEIVKSGMEMSLNERQITDINTMIAQPNVPESDILARLFTDTPKVIYGIYELMERSFLQGLSTGVTLVDDSENAGIGIRMDFGYLEENKFKVATLWTDTDNAKPLDDIKGMVKSARNFGREINFLLMDDDTLDLMTKTKQVREYFAWSLGFTGSTAIVPEPTLEQLNERLARDNRYGFQIVVIKRKVILEKNGIQTTDTPWEPGMIIGLQSMQVGVLAWANLAETLAPVNGIDYENAGNGILVSKFSTNRPTFAEYTTAQARMVPVICNVEQIYQLNTKEVKTVEPQD